MERTNQIKDWVNSLLSSNSFKPDDISIFTENLTRGLVENNKEFIDQAFDELSAGDIAILEAKLVDFNREKNKADENIDIEQILKDHNEIANIELRKLLIEAKTHGRISKALEFIKGNLSRKKIKPFEVFLMKFQPINPKIIEEEKKEEEGYLEIEKELTTKEYTKTPTHSTKLTMKESPKTLMFGKDTSIKTTPSHSIKTPSFYILYETFEDASSEYKMNKIKFNLENLELMLSYLKYKDGLEVIGFYGNNQRTFEFLIKNFELDLNLDEIHLYLHSNKISECLLSFEKENKLLLFFLTQESIYNFTNKADSDLLAVIYIRYLIDLCHNIFIIPSNDWKINPDNTNPFMDKINPKLVMKERIVEPSDKIKLNEIPVILSKITYVQDLQLNKYMLSPDYSRFLTKGELKIQESYEVNKQEVNYNDIKFNQNSYYYYSSYSYKKMSYNEIKNDIEKYWIENNIYFTEQYNPRKFIEKAKAIFKSFIQNENLMSFEDYLVEIQNAFNIKKFEIEEKYAANNEILNSLYNDFFKFIEENNCERIKFKEVTEKEEKKEDVTDNEKKEKKEDETFIQKIGNIIGIAKKKKKPLNQCTKNCVNFVANSHKWKYDKKFSNIDWSYIEKKFGYEILHVHRGEKKIGEFCEKLNKNIENTKKDIEENKQIDMKNLRIVILKTFFEKLDTWIIKNRAHLHLSYTFQFQGFNIIRNTSNDIENWNINQAPFCLNYNFGKNTEKNVFLKNIYFLEENYGIFLFAHSPQNKSSLIYFNVSNKNNPLLTLITTLSSPECNLIIEKNMNLWCVYDNKEKRFNIGKISGTNFEGEIPINVYDNWKDGICINQIVSASFLTFSDSIFIINQDFELFELKYLSKNLNLIWRKENKGAEGVLKTKILPKAEGEKYFEIQCTLEGKNILLRSKSTIDIYDLNWFCNHSIPIDENFLYFKTFNEKTYTFLILVFKTHIKCYHFIGFSATKSIEVISSREKSEKVFGNPYIDYIYLAFKKFGPHSDFIGSPSNSKIFLITSKIENLDKKKLEKYFEQINLRRVTMEIMEENKDFNIMSLKSTEIKTHILKTIILSRVPIHIATIENFTLVPLQNGKNISDQITESISTREKSHDLINTISNIIKYGSYEDFLKHYVGPVRVVSIVGRQSSGKSYVMNRFFGLDLMLHQQDVQTEFGFLLVKYGLMILKVF